METIDIMRQLVAGYDITAADAHAVMIAMEASDRALRMPSGPGDLGR